MTIECNIRITQKLNLVLPFEIREKRYYIEKENNLLQSPYDIFELFESVMELQTYKYLLELEIDKFNKFLSILMNILNFYQKKSKN